MDAADAALLIAEVADGEGLPAVPLEAALRRLDKPGCGLCRWAQNALVDEIRRAPACRLDDGDGLIVVTKGGSVHYIPAARRRRRAGGCAHRRPFAFEPAAHVGGGAPIRRGGELVHARRGGARDLHRAQRRGRRRAGAPLDAARDLVELLERRPPLKQAEAAARRVRARAETAARGGAFNRTCTPPPRGCARRLRRRRRRGGRQRRRRRRRGIAGRTVPRMEPSRRKSSTCGGRRDEQAAAPRRGGGGGGAAPRCSRGRGCGRARLPIVCARGTPTARRRRRRRRTGGGRGAQAAAEARAEAGEAAAARQQRTLTPLYALIYDDEETAACAARPLGSA